MPVIDGACREMDIVQRHFKAAIRTRFYRDGIASRLWLDHAFKLQGVATDDLSIERGAPTQFDDLTGLDFVEAYPESAERTAACNATTRYFEFNLRRCESGDRPTCRRNRRRSDRHARSEYLNVPIVDRSRRRMEIVHGKVEAAIIVVRAFEAHGIATRTCRLALNANRVFTNYFALQRGLPHYLECRWSGRRNVEANSESGKICACGNRHGGRLEIDSRSAECSDAPSEWSARRRKNRNTRSNDLEMHVVDRTVVAVLHDEVKATLVEVLIDLDRIAWCRLRSAIELQRVFTDHVSIDRSLPDDFERGQHIGRTVEAENESALIAIRKNLIRLRDE